MKTATNNKQTPHGKILKSLRVTTTKEHDGYTSIITIESTRDGIPVRSLLRWRHVGFIERHHARSAGLANAKHILSYALGSVDRLESAEMHWESNGRNCCPVWPTK